MRKFLNQCNLYLLLWCTYLMQGTLYPSGGVFSVLLLALILVMSLYHFVMLFTWKQKIVYLKGLKMLVIMYMVYGVALIITDGAYTHGMTSHPATFNYLKEYLTSLLPIFSCYYYSKNGQLKHNLLQYWVPIFFIVAIARYYRDQRETLEAMLSGREDITNSSAYIVLSVFPCVYVYKNRWFQIAGIVICVLFVMFGMKRGAVLVTVIAVGVYIVQQTNGLASYKKIFFLASVAIIGLVVYHRLSDTLFQNDYFNERIEQTLEGDSSGRDDLYSSYLDAYWNKFNPIQQIIGIGGEGTLKIGTNHAHNDWIETIVNQGILGLFIFLFYWYYFFTTLRSKRLTGTSKDVLVLIFVMTFVKSFFSMSIGGITIYMASVFGLALTNGMSSELQKKRIQ